MTRRLITLSSATKIVKERRCGVAVVGATRRTVGGGGENTPCRKRRGNVEPDRSLVAAEPLEVATPLDRNVFVTVEKTIVQFLDVAEALATNRRRTVTACHESPVCNPV